MQNAALEFAALVLAEFSPSTDLDDFDAVSAHDEDSGLNVDVPLLLKANIEGEAGRFAKAVSLWELVLYDPNGIAVEPQFKLSRLALGLLRDRGVPDGDLQTISELTEEGPLLYAGFREELRDRFEGASPNEDRISELADYASFRVHTNLAAAHMNLANLYSAWRQLDLAVYHYGMVWAHSRGEIALEKWNQIQGGRKLIPSGTTSDAALRLYLHIPPPSNSNHLPGSFDELVLPPSTVRMEGIQELIRRVAGNAAPPAPQPVEVRAVELEGQPVPGPAAPPAVPPAQRTPGSPPPKSNGGNSPLPQAAAPPTAPAQR